MKKSEQGLVDPELGKLITTRRRAAFFYLIAVLLAPLGFGMTFGGAVTLFMPPHPGRAPQWDVELVVLVLGLVTLAGMWVAVQKGRTKLWFHELGVARTRGRRRIIIPYAQASEFIMNVVHQYHNGIYAGTVVRLRLKTPDGRSIAYDGGYKVKSKGFLKRTFEIKDDLEGIRHAIGEQMADVFIERMLKGEPLNWCDRARLTPDGLTPSRGKAKGQLLTYAQIERQAIQSGTLTLFRQQDKRRGFLAIPCAGTNFWPAYVVFLRLAELQFAVEEPATTADDEGDDSDDD